MSVVRRGVAAVVCALALSVGMGACGNGRRDTSGPYAVGMRTFTFVDHHRMTPAFGAQPALPQRTLVTPVWYPAAAGAASPVQLDAPAAHGPFPLIVFNHGQQGEPSQYALAFTMWARAGYVVAAPEHPLTVRGGPGAQFVDDIAGELGDTRFVIDSIASHFGSVADLDHIAVAGHSSGAISAFASGYDPCCRDHRVDALLLEGFVPTAVGTEPAAHRNGPPVMFIQGTLDPYPIVQVRAVYASIEAPKLFVTLDGGDHSNAFRYGPIAVRAAAIALDFFDYTLKQRGNALDGLRHIAGIQIVRAKAP